MVIQGVRQSERLFMGCDFNGLIGTKVYGYDMTHKGYYYDERKDRGVSILDFAIA